MGTVKEKTAEKPQKNKLRVLILDSGRQALPFLRSLKRNGHYVAIACGSRLTTGYFSRYADKRLIWPNYFQDPKGFKEKLIEYLRNHQPDVTLSVGDISAQIISENKPEILKWTKVTVPDLEIFNRGVDKASVMSYCMDNQIPCPKTFFVEEKNLKNNVKEMLFPVMVKPRRGLGAIGLHRFETAEEVLAHYERLEAMHGDLLIQEFIPQNGGMQFQAEAFLDVDSKMMVCMVIEKPRFFPVTGGTSTANVTIDRRDIQESVRRLLEGIQWTGAADVDLILDPRDNVPKILEINPRVTAGIKIGFAAGIDYADLHLRLAMGQDIPKIDSYKLGVYSRNLCMDILWYIFADMKMRKSTKPSFFKFIGKDVCYQNFAVDDPLPFLGFVLGMVKKYANPKVWKKKLGKDL